MRLGSSGVKFLGTRPVEANFSKMAVSPSGKHIAMWSDSAVSVYCRCRRKMIVDSLVVRGLRHVCWHGNRYLIFTEGRRISSFDSKLKIKRRVMIMNGALSAHKVGRFYIVRHDKMVRLMNSGNEVIVTLNCDDFMKKGDNYVLIFANNVTIFDKDFRPVYDFFYSQSVSNMILDACVWKRKVYMLIGDNVIGHDLNLRGVCAERIYVGEYIFVISNGIIKVHDKNMEGVLFKRKGSDFFVDTNRNFIYILEGGRLRVVKGHKATTLKFKFMDACSLYKEKESEFDGSDNSYVDF